MRTFSVTLVLGLAIVAGPFARQAGSSCIQLPTEASNVSVSPRGASGTSSYTCEFNRPTLTVVCAVVSKSIAGSQTQMTATTYGSIDDLIPQVRVIPPLFRASEFQISGPGETSATSYSYDSQKRLLREVTSTSAGTMTVEYSAWDVAGRPTMSTWKSSNPAVLPSTQVLTYDDAPRKKTVVTTGVAPNLGSTVHTEYDANGNLFRMRTINSVGETVATTTITRTERVCRTSSP